MPSGSNSKSLHSKQKQADHKQPLINPWTPQGSVGKNGMQQKLDHENNMISLRNQNQLL
jgi:hypothetical protein